MLTAILIEDEEPQIEQMQRFISSRKEFVLKDIARDGNEALRKINANSYDLIFLDLNLPKISGSDLIRKINKKPYFIVITSRRDKAIDSLNLGAIDYLLKPVFQDRFNQAVDKFLIFANYKKEANSKILEIFEERKSILIDSKDILFIEANRGFSIIHTEDKIYKTRKGLIDLLEDLQDTAIEQIHKKYLLNTFYVKKLESLGKGKFFVSLNDSEDTELPVTRNHIERLKNKIMKKEN